MISQKKVIISWILVVIWCLVIFIFSSMDTNESNSKSMSTINGIIESTVDTTNKLGITDKHPTEKKLQEVINFLNKPFRKFAHASEYLILTILVIIALTNSGLNGIKKIIIALIFCFIYASLDEYHQTFVNGRTGQLIDVIIDTVGGMIGCLLIMIVNYLKKSQIVKR